MALLASRRISCIGGGPTAVLVRALSSGTSLNEGIFVVGGNGFVGGAICKKAVEMGVRVASLSRSGRPSRNEDWMDSVDWRVGDALNPQTWEEEFKRGEYTSVVGSIGAFGSDEFMERMNGDCNISAAEVAKRSDSVKRFVFISVHQYNFPSFVLRGYFNGKRRAEKAAMDCFPEAAAILQPGMIYGTRHVPDSSTSIPLNYIGVPLETVLETAAPLAGFPVLGPLLAPPISVDVLAEAVVGAASPNSKVHGIIPVSDIKTLAQISAR